MKFILSLILSISFISKVALSLTDYELKTLSAEKIIEYAKMGDADAQNWYADAIYNQIVKSEHISYDVLYWLEKAASQGHALAAYKYYAYYFGDSYLRSLREDFDGTSVFQSKRSIDIDFTDKMALEFLKQAANAGIIDAYSMLAWHYIELESPQRELAHMYRLKGAELKHPSLMVYQAEHLIENWHLETDPNKAHEILDEALKILEEALTIEKEDFFNFRDDEYFLLDKCNLIIDISRFYEGTLTVYTEPKKIPLYLSRAEKKITSFENQEKYFLTLKEGEKRNCKLAIYSLGQYYLDLYNATLPREPKNLSEAYFYAQSYYNHLDSLPKHKKPFSGLDSAQYLLAEILVEKKEYQRAAELVRDIPKDSWVREFLFIREDLKPLFTSPGDDICKGLEIAEKDCEKYLEATN